MLKIPSVSDSGSFSGTMEFYNGEQVNPIEGQYYSGSNVLTFTRHLSPDVFQSYTGQFNDAPQTMTGTFTQSDTSGEDQFMDASKIK